jgi:hypothetical protein
MVTDYKPESEDENLVDQGSVEEDEVEGLQDLRS